MSHAVEDDSPSSSLSFHATTTRKKEREIYSKEPGSDPEEAPVQNDEATKEEDKENQKQVGYWALMKSNGQFRLFMLSYAVTLVGEWFTYVSSLAVVRQIHTMRQGESRTAISILVALRLIPKILFSNIGGVLADSHDRKTLLNTLDILGSIVAWLFVLSHRIKSLACLYAATFLQMTIASMYEPTALSFISMVVTHKEELKKAMTAIEITWGVMTSVGSALGGLSVDWVGIYWCFIIDSLTYLISAVLIFSIRGKFVAAPIIVEGQSKLIEKATASDEFLNGKESTTNNLILESTTDQDIRIDGQISISNTSTTSSVPSKENDNSADDKEAASIFPLKRILSMAKDCFGYLRSQPWRSFIFIKVFGAFIYGAGDVLNVSLAEHEGTDGSNRRLGIIFASVGVGCFIGPIISDRVTIMDDSTSLRIACLSSFFCMGIGWFGIYWNINFALVCVFSGVRAAGSAVMWIYSTLLLQNSCSEGMLGRVMSIDLVLFTLGETSSAVGAGVLQDYAGFSAEQVSLVLALIAFVATFIWGIGF